MNLFKKVFFLIIFLSVFSFVPKVAFAQELGETSCPATIPVNAPNIVKVDTTRTSATVFFTLPQEKVTGYTIAYGLTQDASDNTRFFSLQQGSSVALTVDNLLLDANYYFRVRSENGCAHGPWSAIRQSNYPNSIGPRLPTTAGESNFLWVGLAGIVACLVGGIVLVYSKVAA